MISSLKNFVVIVGQYPEKASYRYYRRQLFIGLSSSSRLIVRILLISRDNHSSPGGLLSLDVLLYIYNVYTLYYTRHVLWIKCYYYTNTTLYVTEPKRPTKDDTLYVPHALVHIQKNPYSNYLVCDCTQDQTKTADNRNHHGVLNLLSLYLCTYISSIRTQLSLPG